MNKALKYKIRKEVFIPSFLLTLMAVATGLVNNEALVSFAREVFYLSLSEFGWLYQISSLLALIVVGSIFFSKMGGIRLGGREAKPQFSFMATFAMALTGGIAVGVVTYSVNEPIIYLGNIYGEIDNQSFLPGGEEAAVFALARSFHNWSFIPYAMYSIVGLMIGYMHYNKGEEFSISSAIQPITGGRIHPVVKTIIDIVSLLAIALGLAQGLGTGLALISSGMESVYGIKSSTTLLTVIAITITLVFIASSLSGLKKGIKTLASMNAYVFYGLIIILLIVGPVNYILSLSTTSLGYWMDSFFLWSLDTKEHGGEALVTWWTLFDWAIWIAYAPLIGLFLARISYGRTIKEFLIINWLLPSLFGIVWFAVWGGMAIKWQLDGTLDLINIITKGGAVSGIWGFLENFPMATVLIPVIIFTFILSFATAADSLSATIATICTEGITAEDESPKSLKIIWGLSIGVIAYIMVAFGGGAQGIEGIKYLAAAGGFLVIFLFMLVVASALKTLIGFSSNRVSKHETERSHGFKTREQKEMEQ